MKKSICLLAFLLSMLWHVSAVAEKCVAKKDFCFGINWKTATLADVQGINVRAKREDGNTPLHWAAWKNENPDIIAALIQAGADIHAKTNKGTTPLHRAAWKNENPDIIAALIQAGADIHAKAKDENTPLHWAAYNNKNPDIIAALIVLGADTQATNNYGETTEDIARRSNRLSTYQDGVRKAIKMVEEKTKKDAERAQKIAEENAKKTAEILKSLGGVNWQTAAVADVAKADLSARHPETGETVLHIAAQYSTPEVIAALIAKGARVGSRDKDGATALHAAVKSGNVGVLAILSKKIDINARDKDGDTMLHYWAGYSGSRAMLDALLTTGAKINARNKRGNAPLHYAVLTNQQQAVLLLLENGADAGISNAEGKTPFVLADENADFQNSEAYWILNDTQYAPAEVEKTPAADNLNVEPYVPQ